MVVLWCADATRSRLCSEGGTRSVMTVRGSRFLSVGFFAAMVRS